MLKIVLKSMIAVVAAVVSGSIAKADFVIDSFVVPNPAVVYSLGTAAGSTYTATDTVSAGVSRNITVTQTGTTLFSGSTNGVYGTTGAGGLFQLNTANISTSASYASLKYTYATAQNLAAGGTSLQFTFFPLTTTAPFSVRLSNGVTTSTLTGTVIGGPTSTTFTLPIAGFGSASYLSSITSVELFLNRDVVAGTSIPDADITVTDVRVLTPNTDPVVPAPAGLVLLLAAAPALGIARLRRKVVA
jgi:hypothetical protein